MQKRSIELIVGLFILAGIGALIWLAFQVSGMTTIGNRHTYQLNAEFDNIGGLKVRAPVSIGGVRIGQVADIILDKNNFRAQVVLQIENQFNNLPTDTSASILTQGILGSNYISLTPGFDTNNLKNNDEIETTHSALILENLIGQLIYNLSDDKSDDSAAATKSTDKKN